MQPPMGAWTKSMDMDRVKTQEDILEIELARLGNGLVKPMLALNFVFSAAESLDLEAPHVEGCFLICFFLEWVCLFWVFWFCFEIGSHLA